LEKLVEKHPNVVRYRHQLGVSLARVVYFVLWKNGDIDEAEKSLHKAFEVRKKVAVDNPWVLEYRIAFIDAKRDLGWQAHLRGNDQEWERSLRFCMEAMEKLKQEYPTLVGYLHARLAHDHFQLAEFLENSRPQEAEEHYRRALELFQQFHYQDPWQVFIEQGNVVVVNSNLGSLLRKTGRLLDSEQAFRRAMELADMMALKNPDGPNLAGVLAHLGGTLVKAQHHAEAEKVLRQCLAIREQKEPDDWRTFNARSLLGGALLGQKKYADAEALLLQGYEGMNQREAKIPPEKKAQLPEALDRLVQLYDAWGKPEKAAPWRAKLAEQKVKTSPQRPKEDKPPEAKEKKQ
jgi:Tfp pilus assembly protein PilF